MNRKPIKQCVRFNEDMIDMIMSFDYDDYGNKIHEIISERNDGDCPYDNSMLQTERWFNKDGQLLKEVITDKDGTYEQIRQYDKYGNINKKFEKDNEHFLEIEYFNMYGDDNLLRYRRTRITRYTSHQTDLAVKPGDFSYIVRERYEYDSQLAL